MNEIAHRIANATTPARSIGAYVPMVDGPEKVSGRAKYTADILQPGMLAGRIYRSPYAHAEIVAVDASRATCGGTSIMQMSCTSMRRSARAFDTAISNSRSPAGPVA